MYCKMQLVRGLPRASAEYDFFCAFSGLLEVLVVRGYDVSQYADYINYNETLKTRFEWFLEDNVKLAAQVSAPQGRRVKTVSSDVMTIPYETVFSMRQEAGRNKRHPRVLHVYILDHKAHSKRMDDVYNGLCTIKDWDGRTDMLVLFNKPKDLKLDVGMCTLEVMAFQQLIVNPALHHRAPIGIKKLGAREKRVLMDRDIMAGRKLVIITKGDPMCLYLDAVPGDIIQYIDARVYTGQALTTVEYRTVSNS